MRYTIRPTRLHALLLLLLAVPCLAPLLISGCASVRAGAGTPKVNLPYEKYTLPNGLEVILRKDSRVPITAVNLWYHVGPANETAGRTGFAHLFEHMMFQGSGHVGEDKFFKFLEGAGASFVNGTTGFDRTNYLEDVPSNQLELALWLESDRMGFLPDRLDQGMLSNQQDVVRSERRQSIENAPYGLAEEEMYHQLFPPGHPYYASVIGSHEDIQNARLEDVRDFFRHYYCPNNASLAIVGDIDVARTKELVTKYFGTIARGPDVPQIAATTPPIKAERRVNTTDKVELPRVYMAWLTAPIYKPGDAEADIASHILGGGKASRLYKSLVYEKKIAQDVSAVQQSLSLGSVFEITATAKPGHGLDELERAIEAELDTMATQGPTAAELDAAKNVIVAGTITSLENVGGFGGQADRLNGYNHYLHDPGYLNQDLQRYQKVSADAVKNLVASELRKDRRVVIGVMPGDKVLPPDPPAPPAAPKIAKVVESKEPWRTEPPQPGPMSTAPLPSAKKFELSNGLAVYLVESHTLPVVTAHLAVRSGGSADPLDLPGLAGFTVAMLDEGTAKRDALTIARDVESLGASLGTDAGKDGSSASIVFLKQHASPALEILSDVTLAPTFPAADIERVRNDRLTSLLQDRDSPARIGFKVMWSALYGPSHPYNHLVIGRQEALQRISRDDLQRFYAANFNPANAALVLAGDLSEAEARQMAEKAFGKWSGQGTALPPPPPPAPVAERILVADKPGAKQSMLVVAQPGVTRADPDFEKLDVMNQILGGLFSSRINLNLREQHGYTYGAGSQLWETRGIGPLTISASVTIEHTADSIREILKEAKGIKSDSISADELRLAKESIARTLPARFQNTRSTVATVGQLFELDLPPDYYEGLPARLEAITPEQVRDATARHLAPDRMKVIAVGDRSKIDAQIRKLGLGPIGFRTTDGDPVEVAAHAAKP